MHLHKLFAKDVPIQGRLVRDSEFESLGYVTHRINSRPFLAVAANERFLGVAIQNPKVSAILTSDNLAAQVPENLGLIASPAALHDFYRLHHHLMDATDLYIQDNATRIDPSARIAASARIAERRVSIGARTVIEEGVVIGEGSSIGDDCVIRANTVIGSEGFEFKKLDGNLVFIRHAGGVSIDHGVRIHAGCMIDKGLFRDPTRIGEGSCLDNLVHVAHGVQIGRQCIIAANAVLAAAVIVGDGARIDPNATVAHEIEIGQNAYVSMGAAVASNVAANARVSGNFAYDHADFVRNFVATRSRRKR